MNKTNEVIKEENVIEIHPLSKGKRAILFLADFFISFIFSIFFFSLAILPLGKVIISYDSLSQKTSEALSIRNEILFENNLLFYNEDLQNSKRDFDACNTYTFDRYVSFLLGINNDKYDVFNNYYVDILHDENTYNNLFENKFFETKNSLKTDYFQAFLPFFDENDEPAERQKEMLTEFQNEFYLPAYATIISLINTNDLTATIGGVNYSFIDEQNIALEVENIYRILVTSSVLISYFISFIICFILVPFINKNGKTIGMLILSIERVNFDHLKLLKKWDKLVVAVFNFALNAGQILFIPMMSVNFNYIFSLPSIFAIFIISILLVVASSITLLFTNFNQTLFDILSRTFCLKTEALDEIYRKKGYIV